MNIIPRRQTWRIERIDTAPMTRQEYSIAVTALATLIRQWILKRETVKRDNDSAPQEQETDRKQGGENEPIDPQAPSQESRDGGAR